MGCENVVYVSNCSIVCNVFHRWVLKGVMDMEVQRNIARQKEVCGVCM